MSVVHTLFLIVRTSRLPDVVFVAAESSGDVSYGNAGYHASTTTTTTCWSFSLVSLRFFSGRDGKAKHESKVFSSSGVGVMLQFFSLVVIFICHVMSLPCLRFWFFLKECCVVSSDDR